jgi:hypothetical protein
VDIPLNLANPQAAAPLIRQAFINIDNKQDGGGHPVAIEAIVVSADAYLTYCSEVLKDVHAHHHTDYYVVYPLQDHGQGTAPKHNSSTIYGPELPLAVPGNAGADSVYRSLGEKSNNAFNGHPSGWNQIALMNMPQDF